MIDKQLIQMQTGHRSTSGVRCYKRPSDDHFKNASKILQPPPSKKSPCNDVTTIENINPSPNISQKMSPKKSPNDRLPLASMQNLGIITGAMPGTFNAGSITFNFNFS